MPRSSFRAPAAAAGLVLLAAAACAREPDGANGGGPPAGATDAARYAPPAQPYREVAVAQPGAIAGVVELAKDVARDTVVQSHADERVCGREFTLPLVGGRDDRLAEAVVWLDDIRAGKALPVERRFTLTNRRCQLEPRVQAAVAGGTLNVKNLDAAEHRTRFTVAGAGDVLESVRQFDPGQVVPVARPLAAPARVEVRCDQHPWTRAWLQVFDHPYFAVTGDDGRFRLDGVPAGSYLLRVWHPRLGTTESRVTVAASQDASVTLRFE